MKEDKLVEALNSKYKCVRQHAAKRLSRMTLTDNETHKRGAVMQIHTRYSFSPYSPSLAAYMAYRFGLSVAGITDNYTTRGAKEFIKACKLFGITYSVGVETRASFNKCGIKTVNIELTGIAASHFKSIQLELRSYRQNQKDNILASVKAVNKCIKKIGLSLDFKREIVPLIKMGRDPVYLSKYVYLALAQKLLNVSEKCDISQKLNELGLRLSEGDLKLLAVEDNPNYLYDLANILFEMRSLFYVRKNYPDIQGIIELGHKYGAICVFEFFIKDKMDFSEKALKELTLLIHEIKRLDFNGVCFNPQKIDDKLRAEFLNLLVKNELLAFNLYKIEFPRQEFNSECSDEYSREIMEESAYVVVGSEMCQNQTGEGFIASGLKTDGFSDRIKLFSKIGRGK